ncbi:hypothetical protein, partial [Endozoicomonas sp. SESOKO4]|uniref:hypothetical protein n=1 Tax=Endozoicomonas sp. SESOKO4 TaxID=2828745 RepID=UPI002147F4F2
MPPRMTNTPPLHLPGWTEPETVVSPPASTLCLSNQTARSGGLSGYSLQQRHITSTRDQRREWISHVQDALGKIDVPFGNKKFQKFVENAQYDLNRMSHNRPGEDEKLYLQSLQKLVNYLAEEPGLPENTSVLQTLADLGLGLEGVSMNYKIQIPSQLLKQLFANTRLETVQKILDKDAKRMMFQADPGFMEILETYLPRMYLKEVAHELLSELKKHHIFLEQLNKSLRLSEGSAPYLITAIFESLGIRHGNPEASQDFLQGITTALASEFFTFQLSTLEVNLQRHEKLILKELKKLDDKEREQLLVSAFVLGQWELFKRLLAGSSPTILGHQFNNGGNILHLMVTALPSMKAHGEVCNSSWLKAYTPRYDELFQYLPAGTLANQQDNSGATPLLLLYRHHCEQLASASISKAEDCQLARAQRSALLKLTASEHLMSCMQNHLDGKFPLNVNWFAEFLQLFKSLPPSTFKAISLRSAECSYHDYLRNKPSTRATRLLQPVINYFELHPDVLRDEQQTLKLIRLIHQKGLPVEYSAQVLRVVTPGIQKKLLGHLSATPDDRDSLFIERCYDVIYKGKRYYPWHLIGLGVGAGCVLNPDRFYCERFLHEVAEFGRKHPKETVPEMSGLWEAELINSRNIEIYGRSLAFPSTEVPQGYRRFKFLKQQTGSTENWHDFIREQPQLDFFRNHKDQLGLESALLKPRGIYRLPHALDKLKACQLPDETLASIALEPDGSALLQVFDDEKNTRLYHHYPYETEGVAGLSEQASFEGLRLFARDAGRLWQHNFQAPDTLSSFHDTAEGRTWVPTPFFGSQTVPGTMGEWNAQDYPNIAPAPVGMRDWADVRSFAEQTSYSFGSTTSYFITHCERQDELRITELGKAFYGLVINWLRVRHDVDCLDYRNT